MMPPNPRFCSQCGALLETQPANGRPHDVCATCGTVVYRSPPPLAASLVLNERREVLLAKRKYPPSKGAWCLPLGFARAGETIAEAALRALKEQTGLDGRLVRLLDTDSSPDAEHGGLLIVTFEMKKVGGRETASGDAESVAYFPLSRCPELGFSANEKALRICADTHLEDWAIRDSFERLHSDEGKVMLSDALVSLIEEHAEEVARAWLADVGTNASTLSYRSLDQNKLLERASTALSQFGRWLIGREADQEVIEFYFRMGRERKRQGFKLQEVLSTLMLLKKHIWTFAHNHGMWERPIDLYRVLELNRRIVVFFDKAMYHTARGYESDNGS
jgi:8-oxo-dGTP diphosphatase